MPLLLDEQCNSLQKLISRWFQFSYFYSSQIRQHFKILTRSQLMIKLQLRKQCIDVLGWFLYGAGYSGSLSYSKDYTVKI